MSKTKSGSTGQGTAHLTTNGSAPGQPDGLSPATPLIQISHPNIPTRSSSEDGFVNPVFTLGDDDTEEIPPPVPPAPAKPDRASSPPTPSPPKPTTPPAPPEAPAKPAPAKPAPAKPAPVPPAPAPPEPAEMPPVEEVERKVSIKPTPSSSSPGLSQRRGSYNLQPSNSLTVPDVALPRRHSLASTDTGQSRLLSTPSGGSMAQLAVTPSQFLTPYSPGGRSLSSTWSEIDRLERRRGSQDSLSSQTSERRMSGLSAAMSDRLKSLARRFSQRTERFRETMAQPPTPSTGDSVGSKSAISGVSGDGEKAKKPLPAANKLKSLIMRTNQAEAESAVAVKAKDTYINLGCCRAKVPKCSYKRPKLTGAIDPQGRGYLCWLAFITMIYMYNGIACTLRAAFRSANYYAFPHELREHRLKYETAPTATHCVMANYTDNGTSVTSCFVNDTEPVIPPFPYRTRIGYETPDNRMYWWIVDYTCDLIYLIDIILVRSRIQFIRNGLYEKNIKLCAMNYRSKTEFKLDLLALLPLDLFYLLPALEYNSIVRLPRMFRYDVLSLFPLDLLYAIPQLHYSSLVRLPRILRIHICWEFFDRLDQVAKSGYIIRVIRTLTYMLYLIHIETCCYYAMSAYEGLGRNQWVYSGKGIAYVRCMYLATKTATSIGNNPKPEETLEYLFMTVYWLSGVFVFAMLIGQIRDIFQSATAAETYCRRSMDRALGYMQNLNVPKELLDKVRTWFNYNWDHQKTLNENSLLEGLPIKMMTDLAIAVHFQTLSKVQLFQDCEKNLLYDLVLKLQPVLYLPNDYICKKGEVGTEMYIVKQGQVEVVGGENDSLVFATLHEGSVFGEISLLGIQGGNRRTASVRSKGFSNLFLLTKDDFEAAMADYPEAHKLLKRRSMKVLAKNQKKVEESKKMEAEEIIKEPEETPKMVRTVISLLEPESKMYNMIRRSSRRGSMFSEKGMDSPTEVIRGDLDLLSNESDDEILVVETEERHLPSEAANDVEHESNKADRTTTVTITMAPAKEAKDEEELRVTSPVSELSLTTKDTVDEILATPTNSDKEPTAEVTMNGTVSPVPDNRHIPFLNKNKVGPAEIRIENDVGERVSTPKKKAKRPKSRSRLLRSNKVDVEQTNGDIPNGKTNSKCDKNIPPENQVTCDVEIHREKSPSLTSPTVICLSNEGFVGDDEEDQINDRKTETPV